MLTQKQASRIITAMELRRMKSGMSFKTQARTARVGKVLESPLDRRGLVGICESSMFPNRVVRL